LARARAAAAGKNVILMGGADLLRQYLAAGLVDELTLTIAPVLLGAGKRLFDGISRTDIGFERTAVIESPFATHLRFRVATER
jgi:dihydrofolate reductase